METDPALFREALLNLAGRLERDGKLAQAAELYAGLDDPVARDRLNTLLGTGGAPAARMELQLRNLCGQMLDPASLLAMLGGGAAFRLVRLGSLGWIARGLGGPSLALGRSALATGLALSAEASSFTLLHRFLEPVFSGASAPEDSLPRALASSHLNFAGLRLGAATLGRASPILGLLSGVALAQGLESASGLRPMQDTSLRAVDILAASAQFYLTGRLLEGLPLLQRAWARLEGWAYRGAWISGLRREARSFPVDLLPRHRLRYLETLEAASQGRLDPVAARDRLTQILRDDYLEKLRPLGVVTRESSWQEWLRERGAAPDAPAWIQRALADPQAVNWRMQRLEFEGIQELSPESAAAGERELSSLNASGGLHYLLEKCLSLPTGTLFGGSVASEHFLMLPVEAMWRLGEYQWGRDGVLPEVVESIVSQERLAALAVTDRRPILLSGRYWSLHGFDSVHPSVAWEHDIYHLLDISEHAPAERREIVDLYGILRWARTTTPEEAASHREMLGTWLDGKFSQNGDHSRLFYQVFGRGFSEPYRRSALRLLRGGLPSLERGAELLRQAERAAEPRRGE